MGARSVALLVLFLSVCPVQWLFLCGGAVVSGDEHLKAFFSWISKALGGGFTKLVQELEIRRCWGISLRAFQLVSVLWGCISLPPMRDLLFLNDGEL